MGPALVSRIFFKCWWKIVFRFRWSRRKWRYVFNYINLTIQKIRETNGSQSFQKLTNNLQLHRFHEFSLDVGGKLSSGSGARGGSVGVYCIFFPSNRNVFSNSALNVANNSKIDLDNLKNIYFLTLLSHVHGSKFENAVFNHKRAPEVEVFRLQIFCEMTMENRLPVPVVEVEVEVYIIYFFSVKSQCFFSNSALNVANNSKN
jgi:hypothetical protein